MKIGNKKILFDYFSSIGNIVFNCNEGIDIDEKTVDKERVNNAIKIVLDNFFAKASDFEERLKQKRNNNNNDNSLEQFTWKFIDMLSWAKKRNNTSCADILVMTQKMQNIQEQAQNKILYHEKFTDGNDEKIS